MHFLGFTSITSGFNILPMKAMKKASGTGYGTERGSTTNKFSYQLRLFEAGSSFDFFPEDALIDGVLDFVANLSYVALAVYRSKSCTIVFFSCSPSHCKVPQDT